VRSCDNALGNDGRTFPTMCDKSFVVHRGEDADKVCLAIPTSLLTRFHNLGITGMFRLPDVGGIHHLLLPGIATSDLIQITVSGDGVAPFFHVRNGLRDTLDPQSFRKRGHLAQGYPLAARHWSTRRICLAQSSFSHPPFLQRGH